MDDVQFNKWGGGSKNLRCFNLAAIQFGTEQYLHAAKIIVHIVKITLKQFSPENNCECSTDSSVKSVYERVWEHFAKERIANWYEKVVKSV